MTKFDFIAFDLYGTVLDVSGLARRLVPFVGEAESEPLLARWRRAQLQRTWDLNARKEYEPFDRVTADALAEVAPQLAPAARDELTRIWQTVPAHKDAKETLAKLRGAGVRTAILSNGTRQMIQAALDAGGLAVDTVRSADEVRCYKPDPRVYSLLDSHAPRARTLFVSSNGWDAEGAKRDGRTVAFIDRGNAKPTISPDHVVRTLAELATIAL
jgi:2-haloacid dehalogenase